MNLLLAQAAPLSGGFLATKLLAITLSSGEWVLWLLSSLSIASVAIILERLVFFSSHRLKNSELLAARLAQGQLTEVQASLTHSKGLESAVLRDALASADRGADTVEQVIAAAVARERPQYERFLSFLGTLGSNAPFVGLFGTVLGIIKAFHDMGQMNVKGAAIQQTVMAGISEALVATAVGLAVAIPAVVAYNGFNRWLKTLVARTQALTYALVGYLRAQPAQKVG
jgi:biopolymer transport protein ExbB